MTLPHQSILLLALMALLSPAALAAAGEDAPPVDVQPTSAANGQYAALSLTGDAHGGVAAATLTGDAHGGVLAATLTGDAEGGLAFSAFGWACSTFIPRECSNGSLPLLDAFAGAPRATSAIACAGATVVVWTPAGGYGCEDGCSRQIVVLQVAILASGSTCSDEDCDRNILTANVVVGGDGDLCSSAADLLDVLPAVVTLP